jgi:glycosyltransferase involved in cell wall biosynthesis
MKVGVVICGQAQEIGGGYTFETELFQSLLALFKETKHYFRILCNEKRLVNLLPELKSVGLDYTAYARFDARVAIEQTLSSLSWRFNLLYHRFARRGGLEMVARQSGVEFLWFLNSEPVNVDLPYLTVVWDLQHRLQPWFPEFSAGGEWDAREAHYSRFLRRASTIITGTRAGLEEVHQFYQVPIDRIRILPHPTPSYCLNTSNDNSKNILSRLGVPLRYIFYPAQFWPHKNHANLLLGVSILRDMYGLVISVVLTGTDKGNLKYIRKLSEELGLSDQVHFLGFRPQEDLVTLYKNAIALTYVSFCGPENLPPLEAFALGCPVVASDVAGAREQLAEAAILVDPGDPEQIAGALKLLYDNPSMRQQLITKGYERATRWTGQDFVRGVFKILDEFESVRRCWQS